MAFSGLLKVAIKKNRENWEQASRILSYHTFSASMLFRKSTSKYDPSKHSQTSYFSTKLKSCSGEMDVNWWKLRRIAKSFLRLRAKYVKFQWLSVKILPQSRIPPYNASERTWSCGGFLLDPSLTFQKKWIRLEHAHNYSLSIFWFLNWAHWKSDEKYK